MLPKALFKLLLLWNKLFQNLEDKNSHHFILSHGFCGQRISAGLGGVIVLLLDCSTTSVAGGLDWRVSQGSVNVHVS